MYIYTNSNHILLLISDYIKLHVNQIFGGN